MKAFAILRALIFASLFVTVWWWLATIARRFDARLGGPLPVWLRAFAIELIGVGAILGLACVFWFAIVGHGTPAPFDPPKDFVATGPYRFVRNPMYIGAALTLVGVGLWLQSPGIVLLAVVGLLIAHSFVVLFEEPALEKQFGESYRAYKRSVNRWIPRRPKNIS